MSAIMTENTTVVIMKMLVSSVAVIGMVKRHLRMRPIITGTVLAKAVIVNAREQSGMEWMTCGPLITLMVAFIATMITLETHTQE